MAAAGLWTTPTDLAKWAIALQRAFEGRSTTLMSQASAKAMVTPGLGNWGLGVEVDGAGDALHFSHGGDDWGFKAQLVGYLTGGRAVVVMANGDDGMVVAQSLIQAVAREYGWKGLEPKVVESVALGDAAKQEVVGSYGHGRVVISVEGPRVIGMNGDFRFELIPQGADRFILDFNGEPGVLKRGPDGRIIAVEAAGIMIDRDP
jgi:hypothetical protein